VREQITLRTREELPYAVAVVIDRFEEGTGKSGKPVARISATIHVDKPSQKAILVGKGGAMLKAIGTAARGEIEEMIDRRVHLELFVRVTAGWARSAAMVQKLSEEG
jgi:GTP-binding protein Era